MLRAAGRPLPTLSGDDVVDFQIAEALVVKDANEQIAAEKKREREDWKKQHRQMGE